MIGLNLQIRPDGSNRHTETFHSTAAEYTFFLHAHGTLSRIDHMLGHETRPNKF